MAQVSEMEAEAKRVKADLAFELDQSKAIEEEERKYAFFLLCYFNVTCVGMCVYLSIRLNRRCINLCFDFCRIHLASVLM